MQPRHEHAAAEADVRHLQAIDKPERAIGVEEFRHDQIEGLTFVFGEDFVVEGLTGGSDWADCGRE